MSRKAAKSVSDAKNSRAQLDTTTIFCFAMYNFLELKKRTSNEIAAIERLRTVLHKVKGARECTACQEYPCCLPRVGSSPAVNRLIFIVYQDLAATRDL